MASPLPAHHRGELTRAPVPVIGFAAVSGTGKTTLLVKLIPLLRARGLRIGLVKRAHHSFDTDIPGKNSYELRKAGATQVLTGSCRRWALVVENEQHVEPGLSDLIGNMRTDILDLIIVEGFRSAPIPKIEVHRPSLGRTLIAAQDPYIIAVATDEPHLLQIEIPVLDLNQAEAVAEFLCHRLSMPEFGMCNTRLLESRLPALDR